MNVVAIDAAAMHVAIMADSHQGYGMPIGGVMATQGVVVPNAVGVDIGCGMCAVKTSSTEINIDSLKSILGMIRKLVPVGFNKHQQLQSVMLMPETEITESIVTREYLNARKSVGTLGGGNHFIEIQKGDDGYIWIMVHSGSRNLGKQVADHYNKVAKEINAKYYSMVLPEWDLAFLHNDSLEGQSYLSEMRYCVDFALCNRSLIMTRIQECFDMFQNVSFGPMINIAHNYAQMENHFGQNVMVHRKGATLARENTIGIIPGSQGTSSYIVKGKGNPDSFTSCSHGAGRAMGRKQAERTLDLEAEQKRLDYKGILHSVRGVHDLDEAAGAYKDIETVMAEQSDLVTILVRLEPLAVVKG